MEEEYPLGEIHTEPLIWTLPTKPLRLTLVASQSCIGQVGRCWWKFSGWIKGNI